MNKDFFKYILVLLIFGSNGVVASHIDLSSYEIVLMRTLIGSIFLVAVLFLSKTKLTFYKNKRHFFFICLSGICMGLNWMFLYEAYAQIGVGIASLCCYCGPVIVMAVSPILFNEKLTVIKVTGFIAVLIGIVLVNGQGEGELNQWGILCGMLSAVMYALLVIFNKKAESIKGLENSALQILGAFLTVSVFIGFKQGFNIEISTSSIIPILILGIVNTGLGCYLYFSSIGAIPVQTVAICGYVEPLAAVIFSVVLLNEIMTPLQVLGAVLIIGGAMFSECFKKEMLKMNFKTAR